ncbi:unnamed protein product [marine sediment metagenome]|uniref:Nudix hydrolase domain-containing protein n=1 Tax=marine sediment metagenome TaxID=412755 RepID=X1A0J0_9ZZZZ
MSFPLLTQNDLTLLNDAHGSGSWSPAGGHLEFGETLEQCAAREVLEETGIVLNSVFQGSITNDIYDKEDKHYITIFMISHDFSGKPKLLEPDKCEGWQWFDCDKLPGPLFLSVQNLLKQVNLSSLMRDHSGSNRFQKTV